MLLPAVSPFPKLYAANSFQILTSALLQDAQSALRTRPVMVFFPTHQPPAFVFLLSVLLTFGLLKIADKITRLAFFDSHWLSLVWSVLWRLAPSSFLARLPWSWIHHSLWIHGGRTDSFPQFWSLLMQLRRKQRRRPADQWASLWLHCPHFSGFNKDFC